MASENRSVLASLFLATALLFCGVVGAPVIYLLLIAMVALTLVGAARRQQLWIKAEPASLLFGLSFFLFALAFVLSAQDFQDTIFAFNYLPLILFLPLTAFLSTGADVGNARRFAWLALTGTVIIFAVALIQITQMGIPRAHGLQVDPIAMGHTAIMLGFMTVVGYRGTQNWTRYILLLGPIVGICAALLTGSRGPIVAAPPLTLIALIYVTRRPLLSIVALGLTTLAALLLLWAVWPHAFSRLETLFEMAQAIVAQGKVEETSTGQRIDMYRGAFMAFFDSPWFGHGWERKFPAIAPYLPSYWNGFEGHEHLHSDIADTAVTTGTLGLVAYILLLVAPVAGAFKSPNDDQSSARLYLALALSIGYFVFGLTYLLFGYEYHTTLYVILAAATIGFCRDRIPGRQGHR